MALIYVIFFLIAFTNALPSVEPSSEQQNIHEMTQKIVDYIHAFNTTKEQAEGNPFIISGCIENTIQEIISKIPDPLTVTDLIVHEILGDATSITVKSHGVTVSGLSSLYVDSLRVGVVSPLRARITYKFVLPKLAVHFDTLYINININGINLNIRLSGQVAIYNSSVEGRATVITVTQRLTDLTTIIKFGEIQSTLVGTANSINITSLIASIVTDIIPQLLNLYSNQINKAVASFIMGLL